MGAAEQVKVERTVTVTDTFDQTHWLRQLGERYQAREDWYAASRTLGTSGRLEVTIVGPALIIYRITNNSASQPPRLLMTSESRCTVPDAG